MLQHVPCFIAACMTILKQKSKIQSSLLNVTCFFCRKIPLEHSYNCTWVVYALYGVREEPFFAATNQANGVVFDEALIQSIK